MSVCVCVICRYKFIMKDLVRCPLHSASLSRFFEVSTWCWAAAIDWCFDLNFRLSSDLWMAEAKQMKQFLGGGEGAEQREADERGRGRDDDDLLLFQRKSFKQDTCCWPHRLHHFYFPLFLFFIVENTTLEDDRPRIQRNTVDIDRNRTNIQTKFSQKAQNPQMMQYRCKYNRNPIKSDRIWTEFQLEPNEVQCNDQLELMVTKASGWKVVKTTERSPFHLSWHLQDKLEGGKRRGVSSFFCFFCPSSSSSVAFCCFFSTSAGGQ